MSSIILKPGRDKSIKNRHPWLFSGAIKSVDKDCLTGDIVEVYSVDSKFLGKGFYNAKTSIAIRFLTFTNEVIDEQFWIKKIQTAYNFRKNYLDTKQTNAFRVIHGEADFLPGLVVDYYNGYCVMQISSSGTERLKETMLNVIEKVIQPKGIFERSDLPTRKAEGLQVQTGLLRGEIPDLIEVLENGKTFLVDVKKGQKTGFFLDQRENRQRVGELAVGKKVLNCFCYSGGFTVYAAANASETMSIDISEEAIDLAQKNLAKNGLFLNKNSLLTADVFEALREMKTQNQKFEMIILDPPAFAKNKEAVVKAGRGYKDINMLAMQLLAPDGILVTCSCSQHVDRMLFQKFVHDAAVDAKRDVQIIESRGQASDHPINLAHPEGDYLKCLICRVV